MIIPAHAVPPKMTFDEPNCNEKSSTAWRAALCALALLALVLNFVGLGGRSIGLDESTSIEIARGSFREVLTFVAGRDPNMGLYYALLHFWVQLFGEGEAAVRSLSAISGALAVPVVAILGARLFNQKVGFVAGLLIALNGLMVQQAQTARSYAILILLVSLASWCFVEELRRPSRLTRIGYVLAAVAGIYAHYFAVLVVVAHFSALLARGPRAALNSPWVGVGAAVVLLSMPEVLFAVRRGSAILSWIAPPRLVDIPALFVTLAGGSYAAIALFAGGVWAATQARIGERAGPHVFVGAWLLLPVALAYLVSLVQPVFLSRYLIICLPALMLFGAAPLQRLSKRPAAALALLLAGLCIPGLAAHYDKGSSEDWRGATRSVHTRMRPDDAVQFFPEYADLPFEYYERRASVSRHGTGSERIWLVIRETDARWLPRELASVRALLVERYDLSEQRSFGRVGVELYVRRPSPPSP